MTQRQVILGLILEDWNRLYLKHRVYLYGIKSLELQMVKQGSGKAGARYVPEFMP
jgi:hypothetical protein